MWTYDLTQFAITTAPANPTALAAWLLPRMRVLIGDTLTKDQQLSDEELGFFMSQRTNVYGAAADACRSLAARLSREADSTQGNLHTLYSSRARAYAARAGQFEVMAAARSAGLPYSGMTSQADYQQIAGDPDRIAPQFNIGMDENRLPVGPGPQSESSANDQGGSF